MTKEQERKQFRTLTGMMLRNQLRGREGKSRYARLLSISVSYGIAAGYLGWSLSRAFYEPAYLIVTYSVMLYIAGFTFISSYPLILLDKSDRGILQQFPITDRVLSQARIANLLLYILYVSIPFVVPLSLFYGFQTGNTIAAILHGVVLLIGAVWATLFFLLFTLQLLQRSPRFQAVLSGVQMLLVFGLLIFYQAMPRYFIHTVQWEALYSSAYAYFLPPFWLTGVFRLATWETVTVPAIIGCVFLLLTAAFMIVGIARSWTLPLEALLSSRKTRKNFFLQWIDSAILRGIASPSMRAGYDFFSATVFRERSMRLQILPMALMPIAAALYGILSGELSSPFPQILTGWYSKMHIPVMVFFLFVARHSEHVAMFSPVYNAQWIAHTQTRDALGRFRSGVRLASAVRILLPVALALLLLFTITMPLGEAVLQAVFVFMAGITQDAAFGAMGRRVPFTQDANQIEAFRRISQLFVVIPFLIVFWLLHYFTSASYISFIIMLIGLGLTSMVLSRISRRRTLILPAW